VDDREALLEAVFAAPDDAAPKLIYADWLDENGEPAQADFIRFQIDPSSANSPSSRVHLELEKFMRLAEEIGCDVEFLPRYGDGFPLKTAISVERFCNVSSKWWPRIPVAALETELSILNVDAFIECAYLERVRELALVGEDPHGHILPILVMCESLTQLSILDLSSFTLGIEATEALSKTDLFDGLKELRAPKSMRPNREAGRLLRDRYGDRLVF
jgi:uncharacterized protein (TIGR02996 family)